MISRNERTKKRCRPKEEGKVRENERYVHEREKQGGRGRDGQNDKDGKKLCGASDWIEESEESDEGTRRESGL